MEHHPMIQLIRRFRSALIAIGAVVFSASIVLAAQPGHATGAANAAAHSAKNQANQGADESQEPDESEAPEASGAEGANDCNVDFTGDLSGFTHGQIVCSAAQMATPSGYANHGAWVSHWAHMNHGADASAKGKDQQPSH
jgi:hypothetical protein